MCAPVSNMYVCQVSAETTVAIYYNTVLHSKRVDFYHCVVFAVFLGETCMYPHLT